MKTLRFGVLPVLLAIAVPAQAQSKPLTNSDVATLMDAGLGEEAVIAKIETTDGEYDTEIETLLALREQGIPSAVIAAMVKKSSAPVALSDNSPDPMVPHYPGVYLMDDWSEEPRMQKIDSTTSTQTKTGGILGYALTGGIASASVKAVIPGKEAKFTTPHSRPTFYVYLDSSAGNQSGAFATGFGSSLQSPNEFSLVKLKTKKGRREARIGSMNIAGAKAGVMDKDQIPFTYERLGQGVFKLTPEVDLKEGQYGFVFAVTGGSGPGVTGAAGGARIFGFGVDN